MKKQIKKKEEVVLSNNIENCNFYGVKWDEPSLEVMRIVAKGLLNLTELFKSQNVTIGTLLQINDKNIPPHK